MDHGRDLEQTQYFHSPSETGANTFSSGPPNLTMFPGEQSTSSAGEGTAVPRQLPSVQVENGVDRDVQEYRSATFARINARRQSTMSRLGSRILPNSVIRGLLSSEEETPAEGQAHRHGLVSRSSSRYEGSHTSSRFSPFGSLGSRGITRRRSTIRAPYFVPRANPALNPDTPHSSSRLDTPSRRVSDPGRESSRRNGRLHRVRNSLSTPISHMFGHPSHHGASNSSQFNRPASSDDTTNLPSLPISMDTRMDIEDPPHELDSVEPAIPNNNNGNTPNTRRLPSILRPRSARVLRREEPTPLSRVLQLAAAAIAAQLSGTTGPVIPNIQALGNGGQDGSLENFIQTLQNAASTPATPTAGDEGPSAQENGPQTPVNFLRVFRFSNPDNSRRSEMPGHRTTSPDNHHNNGEGTGVEESPGDNDGRTVTLVVVGVRSVPAGSNRGSEQPSETSPGLDALLGLPFLSRNNTPQNHESNGNRIPRADGRPRAVRRPFSGGAGGLFANRDGTRQQGVSNFFRRPSEVAARGGYPSAATVPSESPAGTSPPSTSAESGSLGSPSPNRRLSAASMSPHLPETQPMQPTVENEGEGVPLHRARQRRRSDSEYARHRDLGAGSVRRNGVVEPDNSGATTGRSWLIYVVGTNVSESHPAFATPSLFTDVRKSSITSHTSSLPVNT